MTAARDARHKGVLDLSKADAGHDDLQQATELDQPGARGPGVSRRTDPKHPTQTAYFYEPGYQPYGSTWGGNFAPTKDCNAAPSEAPSESPSASPSETVSPIPSRPRPDPRNRHRNRPGTDRASADRYADTKPRKTPKPPPSEPPPTPSPPPTEPPPTDTPTPRPAQVAQANAADPESPSPGP